MASAGFRQVGPNVFINFGATLGPAPLPPTCCRCSSPPVAQTHPDSRLWCGVHFVEIKREIDALAKSGIQASVEAIFAATRQDRRKRLYRALAAVWHPDAGGDAALMVALNAASEKIA
jgi:hypothetical protein